MTMTYENFQDVGSEEKTQRIDKAPPLPSGLWNICSASCLLLLFSLGLSFLLLVAVGVIGSKNSQVQGDLLTLRRNFSNFTAGTGADVQKLTSQGHSFQELIKSLKDEVEDHRQELQTVHSLNQSMASLKSTLKKKEEELKADQSSMFLKIQKLVKDLKILSCEVVDLKRNGSVKTCCPPNWLEYEGSCYWFSQSGKSWSEADKDCQLENAHLVVVNSQQEQNFINSHIRAVDTWMGLTDQNGPWRWVDGTDYEQGFKNWRPEQPDNWEGHGLGGGEDCAHFSYDGRWNDDVCQKPYRRVCETKLETAS